MKLLGQKLVLHLLSMPKVNLLPMIFGVPTPKVNGMDNEFAMFVNQILDGSLFQVVQLMKGKMS